MQKRGKDEAEPGPVLEFTDNPVLRKRGHAFFLQVQRHLDINAQIKQLEAEKKELGVEIGAALEMAGMEKVRVGEMTVTMVRQTKSYLDKKLLVENGVTAEQIEKSTTFSQVAYPLITAPKVKE